MASQEAQIDNPHQMKLPTGAAEIIRFMFAGYGRVTIAEELGGGFSGSRVFIAHPMRRDGTPELPAVVKLGPIPLIEQEWQAYQAHIQNQLPGVAELRGGPAIVAGVSWAGLRYPLVGSGAFAVESLTRYYCHASPADLSYVLANRLFRQLGPLWRFSYPAPGFSLRHSYDRLLPVNFLVQVGTPPAGVPVTTLQAGVAPAGDVRPGEYVCLEEFVVEAVEQDGRKVTLNWAPAEGQIRSFRVRLQDGREGAARQVGQVIAAVRGRVVSTRLEALRAVVLELFGAGFAVDAERITLAGGRELPNPLARLPAVLAGTPLVRVAAVHGDLNPENILVDPETREVHLIDFANARRDHVLHDLLRLETGIVTRLLPETVASHKWSTQGIVALYEQLHDGHGVGTADIAERGLEKAVAALAAVREAARELLYDPDDWGEYYDGLTLYLLGAHKYHNLERKAKEVAFYGAAAAQYLRDASVAARHPIEATAEAIPIPVVAAENGRQEPVDARPAWEPPKRPVVTGEWLLPAGLIAAILLLLAIAVLSNGGEVTGTGALISPSTNPAVVAAAPTATEKRAATVTRRPTATAVAGNSAQPCGEPAGDGAPLHADGEPLTVVIVFDASRRMAGERLLCAIIATRSFIRRLGPADRLYLFTFGEALSEVLGGGVAGETSDEAHQRLANLFAGGQFPADEALCDVTIALAGARANNDEPIFLLLVTGDENPAGPEPVEDCLATAPELRLYAAVYGNGAGAWTEVAEESGGAALAVEDATIGSALLSIEWQP
jgi:hypothetical protein